MSQILPVVIVGAGPTGLALGAELRRLGISALILDKLAAGENTSRATVVHARTLEVLEPLNVSSELIESGVIVPIFRMRDREKVLATIDFKDLKSSYPFTLMCPQDRVEAILLRRLESLGGVVERHSEVVEVQPLDHAIQVRWRQNGETRTVQAQWVVGCDGAHSVVREQAQIPFEGGSYDESFVLADVEMNWPVDRNEIDLFFSEKGFMVVAPLPENRFRIVATVKEAAAAPSIEDIARILAERGPPEGVPTITRMFWSSRFHIQHRVASTLRQGNILLAGDAAHVHSPAGGQGMNTGLQDAVSLAGALRQMLSGDSDALKNWEEKRLKVAHSVVALTDRMTKMATTSSPVLKSLRNTAIEWLGHIPAVQHELAETLAELKYR